MWTNVESFFLMQRVQNDQHGSQQEGAWRAILQKKPQKPIWPHKSRHKSYFKMLQNSNTPFHWLYWKMHANANAATKCEFFTTSSSESLLQLQKSLSVFFLVSLYTAVSQEPELSYDLKWANCMCYFSLNHHHKHKGDTPIIVYTFTSSHYLDGNTRHGAWLLRWLHLYQRVTHP